MSYLILIISVLFFLFAIANASAQVLQFFGCLVLRKPFNSGFGNAVIQAVISFALLCLAIYVNHWPKR